MAEKKINESKMGMGKTMVKRSRTRTQIAPGVTELIVNGVRITVVTRAGIRKHDLAADEIKWLFGGTYLYSPSFYRGKLYDAAGYDINKIDFAVPQSWASQPQIKAKYAKGDRAVWSYEKKNAYGKPVWDSEAWRKLRVIIKRRISTKKK